MLREGLTVLSKLTACDCFRFGMAEKVEMGLTDVGDGDPW